MKLADRDPRLYDLRGGHISMVFQEPMTALSPVHDIGGQVAEAILCHRDIGKEAARAEAAQMLERVGLDDMERRMGMVPVRVLRRDAPARRDRDGVGVPSRSADLRRADHRPGRDHSGGDSHADPQLQHELGNSVIFITHDLGVVAQIADHVVVMYQGRVLEIGTGAASAQTAAASLHPGLLQAIPGRCAARRTAGHHRERGW